MRRKKAPGPLLVLGNITTVCMYINKGVQDTGDLITQYCVFQKTLVYHSSSFFEGINQKNYLKNRAQQTKHLSSFIFNLIRIIDFINLML